MKILRPNQGFNHEFIGREGLPVRVLQQNPYTVRSDLSTET